MAVKPTHVESSKVKISYLITVSCLEYLGSVAPRIYLAIGEGLGRLIQPGYHPGETSHLDCG